MSLAPAAASVLVGMNDTLRGTFDLAGIAADLEQIVCGLQRAGSVVLTASLPDPGLLLRIPGSLRRPLARRAHAINAVLSELARYYEVVHIDLAAHPAIYDRRMWGVDRLHPSERGHRLLARLAGGGARRAWPAPAGAARPGSGQPRAERLGPGALDGHQGDRLAGAAVPGPGPPAVPAGRRGMVA